MRIAVVDDENIVRSRLEKLFAKQGHHVETFDKGEDFLERLKAGGFDLVFLDVVLPGIRGTEVFEAAKSLCRDMEVIFMTGFASSTLQSMP